MPITKETLFISFKVPIYFSAAYHYCTGLAQEILIFAQNKGKIFPNIKNKKFEITLVTLCKCQESGVSGGLIMKFRVLKSFHLKCQQPWDEDVF